MAKKKTAEKVLNIDNILFNCRDILRAARNSGSFFEKRDMMLHSQMEHTIFHLKQDGQPSSIHLHQGSMFHLILHYIVFQLIQKI